MAKSITETRPAIDPVPVAPPAPPAPPAVVTAPPAPTDMAPSPTPPGSGHTAPPSTGTAATGPSGGERGAGGGIVSGGSGAPGQASGPGVGGDATGGGGGTGGEGTALARTSTGSGEDADARAYYEFVRRHIRDTLEYPSVVRRRGLSGTVEIEIVVRPDGEIRDVTLVRSSSSRTLDEAAVEAVKRLPRLRFPAGLTPRTLHVRVPVVFDLR